MLGVNESNPDLFLVWSDFFAQLLERHLIQYVLKDNNFFKINLPVGIYRRYFRKRQLDVMEN
jgi:hypothetical protein